MRTIRMKAVLLSIVVTATALTAPTPAQAAPAPGGGTTGSSAVLWSPATGATTATSEADARRAVDAYWTADRMAAAKPVAVAPGPPAGAAPAAAADQPEVTAAKPVAPAGRQNREAWFSNINGKVFFRNASNGGNFTCSASAINSGSKRLVLTAGHCVHGGRGGTWHQNWVFVPGYNRGARPLGTFPATTLRTLDAYIATSDYTRDVGFVVTGTNSSGTTVVNAAGGHGITFNSGQSVFVHVAGYPTDRDGGETQQYCWGTTRAWSTSAPGTQIDCNFGGGASGGPWLRDYQSNGLGFAVTETMGITAGANYGPPFDNTVLSLYNAVKDQT